MSSCTITSLEADLTFFFDPCDFCEESRTFRSVPMYNAIFTLRPLKIYLHSDFRFIGTS